MTNKPASVLKPVLQWTENITPPHYIYNVTLQRNALKWRNRKKRAAYKLIWTEMAKVTLGAVKLMNGTCIMKWWETHPSNQVLQHRTPPPIPKLGLDIFPGFTLKGWFMAGHLKSTIELHLKLKAAELKEQPYLWSQLRLHNIREVRECSQAYPLMKKATTDHLDKSIFAAPALCAVISVVISLRILAVRASAYHALKC